MDEIKLAPIAHLRLKYDIATDAIQKMRDEFTKLKIDGIKDREGYKEVDKARKEVKAHRIKVEDKRKALKSKILSYGAIVDNKAKELKTSLSEIEDTLKAKTDEIDEEKAKLKREKEEKAKRKLEERINQLLVYNKQINIAILESLSDEVFSVMLEEAKETYKEEKERLRIKEAELKAERKAAALKAEIEKIKAEKAEIERKKREAEENERSRLKEIERLLQAKKDAIRNAKIEEKRKKKAKEEKEKRRLEIMPDKNKIELYFNALKSVSFPNIKDEGINCCIARFHRELTNLIAGYSTTITEI